jgi:hypothetical protein
MTKSSGTYLQDNLEVIVERTSEDIQTLRPVWEEMQAKEPYPVINADIDRFLSVIEASNDRMEPYIILIKQNDQPMAMVLARLEMRPIKFELGYKTLLSSKPKSLTIEYGGILGQLDENLCSFLMEKLMKISRDSGVDLIFFNHLRTDSSIFQLSRKIPGVLIRDNFPKFEKHWSMSAPKNLDQFYKKRSKNHRCNLKRCIRTLEKEYPNQVQIITYTTEDDLDEAIKAASQISCSTYQHGLGCGFIDNPRTRILLTTAARQNWLRMSILFINEEPGAFQIGLKYGKQYFMEQIGFAPKWGRLELGTVLFLKVLEQICADPDIEFVDFGFGDAHYKRRYGDKQWQEASVYIFAPRPYPIFINMLLTLTSGLNIGLEYILKKMGLIGWIKRRWRNLLQKRSFERDG